jgi:hypothetical protein
VRIVCAEHIHTQKKKTAFCYTAECKFKTSPLFAKFYWTDPDAT